MTLVLAHMFFIGTLLISFVCRCVATLTALLNQVLLEQAWFEPWGNSHSVDIVNGELLFKLTLSTKR